MRARLAALLLTLRVCPASPPPASLADLIHLVRSAVEEGREDTRLARTLHHIKLSEALDQSTIQELAAEGAGPKSVAELERLRKASASLPRAAAAIQPKPAPAAADQQRTLQLARESALHYIQSLPDFICMEDVHRYDDSRGRLLDALTLKLSYFDQKEKYQLLTINGRATVLPYESVGGVVTEGEFGSLLSEVFDPRSAAEFHWSRWTTLRRRAAEVYTFRVAAERSHYRIRVGRPGSSDETVAGQHGIVYIDSETRRTVRVESEADSLPRDFPVSAASTVLDYGFVEIGGAPFLLPLHADVRMKTPYMLTRNDVEFHSYKKFGADTTITYTDKP